MSTRSGKKEGRCTPKHPLITRLKQAAAHDSLGNTKSAAYILHNTQRMIHQHIDRDTNKVNAQDEDGNTALHLIVKYYLEANQRYPHRPSSWLPPTHLPDKWANAGINLLYIQLCPDTNSSGEVRKQELEKLHKDCIKEARRYCVCIDPHIKNKAGRTARDLAVEAKANDIVLAIDKALKPPLNVNRYKLYLVQRGCLH